MISWLLTLLTSAVSPSCAGLPPGRWATCTRVAAQAAAGGVPVDLALSLAWGESRFDAGAVSRIGAVGPLQVIPRWTCPRGRADGCDLVRAGVDALRTRLAKHGSHVRALCHYAAGNTCNPRAARYARHVVAQAARIRAGRLPWRRR